MNLYAESSALLAWLLDEPDAGAVGDSLAAADLILTSELTSVECERALIRMIAEGAEASEASALGARLNRVLGHWIRLSVARDVLERARLPFPHEPIPTLDALHLATALTARSAMPDIAVLSLDHRIRANAEQFGFDLLPADVPD